MAWWTFSAWPAPASLAEHATEIAGTSLRVLAAYSAVRVFAYFFPAPIVRSPLRTVLISTLTSDGTEALDDAERSELERRVDEATRKHAASMRQSFLTSVPGAALIPLVSFEVIRAVCRCIQLAGWSRISTAKGTLGGALFGFGHHKATSATGYVDVIDAYGITRNVAVLCLSWAGFAVTHAVLRGIRDMIVEATDDDRRARSRALATVMLFDRVLSTIALSLPLVLAYLSNANGPLVTGIGGFVGIALGLGAQDTARNLIAGLSILWHSPFAVGDKVEFPGKVSGTLVSFGILNTVVLDLQGRPVTVPNSVLASGAVVNRSRAKTRRCELSVVVVPQSAEALAAFVAKVEDALVEHPRACSAPNVHIADLTDAGAVVDAKVMLDKVAAESPPVFNTAVSELNIAVLGAAADVGVDLAFQRRFGRPRGNPTATRSWDDDADDDDD